MEIDRNEKGNRHTSWGLATKDDESSFASLGDFEPSSFDSVRKLVSMEDQLVRRVSLESCMAGLQAEQYPAMRVKRKGRKRRI